MFPPNTFIEGLSVYACPFNCINKSLDLESFHAIELMYHLVKEHKANIDLADPYSIPEGMIFIGPKDAMSAAMLAFILGQKKLGELIIKERAKEFATIKNIGVE